ncbi:phage tail assembly protein [Pseudomonas donghuensis]|uniref:Phage tail assembly protein n=1 Tax=Pseudomonas donghuensis TaxID=1163398 RepID=A0AAP0SIR6_9PSED|nr:phage tail assembly protein [Pseudomonas donghuensis]KDO00845.1 phage tail assembly protein [Pseudomonas donghuensis]PJY93779.1 phage tail assembly protein [Pseudomonas donghuensis]WKY30298.1 phage tail assembly protein [Pseudomonas donghuensis]
MSKVTKNPAWMVLRTDGVQITLSKPTEANGLQVDKLHLRAPTVRDVRTATAASGGDDEQRELALFASLAEVSTKDLESLTIKDYNRLQAGYFRLVQDDEL